MDGHFRELYDDKEKGKWFGGGGFAGIVEQYKSIFFAPDQQVKIELCLCVYVIYQM